MSIKYVINKKHNEYSVLDFISIVNISNISRSDYDKITCLCVNFDGKIVTLSDLNKINEMKSLEYLSIKDANFDNTISYSTDDMNLDNFLSKFKKLKVLHLTDINIKILPLLPVGLEELNVSNNMIRFLQNLPPNLKKLDCQDNMISNIDFLPETIVSFNCRSNSLLTLPELSDSLTVLNCYDNAIFKLPELPNKLEYLICDYNNLDELPKLPDTLVYLDCSMNNIKLLPKLPSIMYNLDCNHNKISELPNVLPSRIKTLYCNNNCIKSLPDSFIALKCLNINKYAGVDHHKKDNFNVDRKCNPDITNNPIWDDIKRKYGRKNGDKKNSEDILKVYVGALRSNVV
jgi:Leucine-rich repeat (LRR) protein